MTDEERDKSRDLHHLLQAAGCPNVTFIRSYWKGQPVIVVALVESVNPADNSETLIPLAITITDEVHDQLMPFWEMQEPV